MHKCTTAHWYGDEFVPPGAVFSDTDPVVTRAQSNFAPLRETVTEPEPKPSRRSLR